MVSRYSKQWQCTFRVPEIIKMNDTISVVRLFVESSQKGLHKAVMASEKETIHTHC